MNVKASRKVVFDQIVKDYDEVRPDYPNKLIEDIISISGIPEDGKILEIGDKLGLDQASFKPCIDEKKYEAKITASTEEALSYSITGTPGFFINHQFIGGAIPYETLKQIIDTI